MQKQIREEFWKSFEKSPFIMIGLEGEPGHSEPMTAQLDRDAHHTIWFFTSRDNRIAAGGAAMAQFSSKGHDVFACLSGTLKRESDASIIDKHWSNAAEAWFPGGRNDPDLIMLRFDIADAEVWTSEIGVGAKLKLLAGKPIEPEEVGEHAVGNV